MEVQGASRTLRDAVGYRSRRFLRRQREISQVFFWDLYDGGEDRLDLLASNPFLEPCLQLYAYFLLWRSWNPAVINCLLTKMRGLEAHSVETELRTCLKTRASRERAATQHPIPSLVSRYGPDVEQCQERNWKERGTVGVVGYPFFLPPHSHDTARNPKTRADKKPPPTSLPALIQPRTPGNGFWRHPDEFPYI